VRRELDLVFRARVTWLVAVLAALLVGHSFILAIDVYAAASRSALGNLLESREMDPLLGIVRPTLGGVSFSLALLGPIIGARGLAIEKERNTYGALCLAAGGTHRVVLAKWLAGALGGLLFLSPALLLFAGLYLAGARLDVPETAVALGGELLHLAVIVSASVAAAAWTRTLAQAITLGVLLSALAWAIDAADGFSALAWLGGAARWSIEQQLEPFGRGVVSIGSVLWLAAAALMFVASALAGASFASGVAKLASGLVIAAVGLLTLAVANRARSAFDWSEQRRASLPPAVVEDLRHLGQPIRLELLLDRDDSRRKQLEGDALAKLALARPDISIRWPLDDEANGLAGQRDADYGLISVQVGSGQRATRSTSRKELVTLVFEAAGRRLPSWEQPPYAGLPFAPAAGARRLLGTLAYLGLPLTTAALGFVLSRRRTIR
jgi:hypothetical protein